MRELKLIILSRYGTRGASSRVRLFQYEKKLNDLGVEIIRQPLLNDEYIDLIYGKKSISVLFVLNAYIRRIYFLWKYKNTDMLWVEKELFPWVPWWLERLLLPRKISIVTDYDDAIFHNYDLHSSVLVRWLLGHKIDRVMKASSLVIVGNSYLATRARASGARRVEVVPTVVDVENYSPRPRRGLEQAPCIGWIGTPSTWNEYMVPILPMLTRMADVVGARIMVVGAGGDGWRSTRIDFRPWSEGDEVSHIQEMDIGIMPLTDEPWAHGKCGYKLIQYMACGIPVVASPVGVNTEIVEHGVNGFLVATDKEWCEALEALLRDSTLRQRMGAAGRRKVETQYSIQSHGPRVAKMIADIARNNIIENQ